MLKLSLAGTGRDYVFVGKQEGNGSSFVPNAATGPHGAVLDWGGFYASAVLADTRGDTSVGGNVGTSSAAARHHPGQGAKSRARAPAPLVRNNFISLNNISNMLRYLYGKPAYNNRKCGCRCCTRRTCRARALGTCNHINGQSLSTHHSAPFYFKMAHKLDLRCGLLSGPSTLYVGAGVPTVPTNTSRIQNSGVQTPCHLQGGVPRSILFGWVFAAYGASPLS